MSVTLNHSLWLKRPSPSALSDCLGMAACRDIGPGPSLLWGRPVHCGMFRSLPGLCTTCPLGRAVISWLLESSCCEGSRKQPRALAPMETFGRPSLLTFSVHDQGLWSPAATLDTQAPRHTHSQPPITAPRWFCCQGQASSSGQCHWFPFLFVKRRTVLRTGFCTTFRVALVGLELSVRSVLSHSAPVGGHIIIVHTSGSERRALLPITWPQANWSHPRHVVPWLLLIFLRKHECEKYNKREIGNSFRIVTFQCIFTEIQHLEFSLSKRV